MLVLVGVHDSDWRMRKRESEQVNRWFLQCTIVRVKRKMSQMFNLELTQIQEKMLHKILSFAKTPNNKSSSV